jgi:hypothetical protein
MSCALVTSRRPTWNRGGRPPHAPDAACRWLPEPQRGGLRGAQPGQRRACWPGASAHGHMVDGRATSRPYCSATIARASSLGRLPAHGRPAGAGRGRCGRPPCLLTASMLGDLKRLAALALCSIPGRASAAAPARISCAPDDNQRSHGARPTTASPRRTTRRRAPTRTRDRRGYRSVRRKEQWPPMCEVLAQARSPAPRASGSTGRCVIEATVSRKVRRSCFRSQPPRRTDPRAAAPLANRQ